jgi:hypothetical protein
VLGVIFLSGGVRQELLDLNHPRIGAMFHPGNYGEPSWRKWSIRAMDCGGFNDRFDESLWLRTLDRAMKLPGWLFFTVPDRFDPGDIPGNFPATMDRWERYKDEVIVRELIPAWVAQNGATPDDIPTDALAVFIGGDDAWKVSEQAWAIVAAARARNCWTHVGRINGGPKFRAGYISCVDSCDGNVLKFGPSENIGRILGWLESTSQPTLPLFGPPSRGVADVPAPRYL